MNRIRKAGAAKIGAAVGVALIVAVSGYRIFQNRAVHHAKPGPLVSGGKTHHARSMREYSRDMASPALAKGDVTKGRKVFRKCRACHLAKEGQNKIGPSLYGVVGRHAGSVGGYHYSRLNQAAGKAGLVWSADNIMAYLRDPQAFLEKYLTEKGRDAPGLTKMHFNLRKEDDRANVIAYLRSIGG